MKIELSLSEKSIDDAIDRIEQAKANLRYSTEQMVTMFGQIIMLGADAYAHEITGDLKGNIQENMAAMETIESPEFVFTTEAVVDVEAHTRDGRWRTRHRKSTWMGQHYARTENDREGDGRSHDYMSKAVREAKEAYPSMAQAVNL
ncbi:MAG: hypothetical protein J6S63_01260 [Atopobiaceae bacterium]|nr:hypothetical protein [Atopobiaceae bacterium]